MSKRINRTPGKVERAARTFGGEFRRRAKRRAPIQKGPYLLWRSEHAQLARPRKNSSPARTAQGVVKSVAPRENGRSSFYYCSLAPRFTALLPRSFTRARLNRFSRRRYLFALFPRGFVGLLNHRYRSDEPLVRLVFVSSGLALERFRSAESLKTRQPGSRRSRAQTSSLRANEMGNARPMDLSSERLPSGGTRAGPIEARRNDCRAQRAHKFDCPFVATRAPRMIKRRRKDERGSAPDMSPTAATFSRSGVNEIALARRAKRTLPLFAVARKQPITTKWAPRHGKRDAVAPAENKYSPGSMCLIT